MRSSAGCRILPSGLLLATVAFGLSALPARATSLTVFDFDDFPVDPEILDDAINTTDYGCRGKAFCTNADVTDARENAISSISTSKDGIEILVSRPPQSFPAGVGVFPQPGTPGGDSFLNPGNVEGSGDYLPYVADFSKDLVFAEVEIGLNSETPLGDFAFLEVWTDPGATGTLIARTEQAFGDQTALELWIATSATAPFRSIKFGVGLDLPGCGSGCFAEDGTQGFVDDIGVRPIPEPSAAVLFGVGAFTAGAATRRIRCPACRPPSAGAGACG